MNERTDANRLSGQQAVLTIMRCLMGLSAPEAMVVLATVVATQIVKLGLPADVDEGALDLHVHGVRGKITAARVLLAGQA